VPHRAKTEADQFCGVDDADDRSTAGEKIATYRDLAEMMNTRGTLRG
jgi:hypothetical protein